MKPERLFLLLSAAIFTAAMSVPAAHAGNITVTPVTTPFITIDPVSSQTAGDEFFINGTTNMGKWTRSLSLGIGYAGFNPAGFGSSFYSSNVSIRPGMNGTGVWSATIVPSQWEMYTEPPPYSPTPVFGYEEPAEYTVWVTSPDPYGPSVVASQSFTIVAPVNTIKSGQASPVTTNPVENSPAANGKEKEEGINASPAPQSAPLSGMEPVITVSAGIAVLGISRGRKRM